MKKLLLLFGFLTLLFAGTPTAVAAEKSYTITFAAQGNDGGTMTATSIQNAITEGDIYVNNITDVNKIYDASKNEGLRFGNSSSRGSFTINLNPEGQVKAKKIIVYAKRYGSDADCKVSGPFDATNSNALTNEYENYEFENSNYILNPAITSIKLSVTTKRGYIKSVTVIYDAEEGGDGGKTPVDPVDPVDPDPTPSEEGYYLTDISKLVTGDIVVIVDKSSSRALNSSNGSSSAPAATQVTLNADKSKLTSTPDNNLLYKIEVTGQNYKFATVTNEKDYLYTTNSNNGVRVGTNTNNTFSWTSGYLKNTATSRYLGVYNNSDWRCYTSSTTNIKSTQTAFYKYVKGDGAPAAPTFSLAEGTYTEAQSVEIFATNGSSIFYTIDGTEPTAESTPYTDAISIDKTTTVKAIAMRDGKASAVASATYTIDIPAPSAPVITINGVLFNGTTYEYEIGKVVPVTVSAKGAESITYTIDGETATVAGSSYTFYVSTDCSCSFFATNTVGDSETVTISFVGVEKPYTFYQIVTSTDQLEYGKEVILAHDGNTSVAMSKTLTTVPKLLSTWLLANTS